MEKIYIEKKTQPKRKASPLYLGSIALAFILITSIAYISLNKDSYSLPAVEPLPEEITTSTPNNEDKVTADGYKTINRYFNMVEGQRKHQLFCLESNIDYLANTKLKKSDIIKDQGLIYLATQLEYMYLQKNEFGPNAFKPTEEDEQIKLINTWLKQTAYWIYLAKIKAPNSDPALTDEKIKELMQTTTLTLTTSDIIQRPQGNTTPLYQKIKNNYGMNLTQVINRAIKYHERKSEIFQLNLLAENQDFKVEGEYYKSGKIVFHENVTSYELGNLVSEVSLSLKAPEGSYIAGQKYKPVSGGGIGASETLDPEQLPEPNPAPKFEQNDMPIEKIPVEKLNKLNFSDYQYLYIYVPKKAIGQEKRDITLEAKTKGEMYTGYYYRGEGAQTVTTIAKNQLPVSSGLSLEIVSVPDTLSSVSTILYTIGITIILIGFGFIYYNIEKRKKTYN